MALGASLIASTAEGDGGPTDDYQIRAYFDNAGFLVKDEEVRIGGATVGTVESVDVSMPGEPVTENGDDDPGKAVAVLNVTDPGFQDFRTDASCIIRPQSLLGEKFVECKPTEAHSALTEPPPELSVIEDGETGEGQRYLPLENNGKAVDIDLVNNIYREPEVDKFRLILNDLGAGLAARGDTLGDVIERANPALEQTDRVLAILAEQNRTLARLARDSDQALGPLARERRRLGHWIVVANETGQASAERSPDIRRGIDLLPDFLRELRPLMADLETLADQGTPLLADLKAAAPNMDRLIKSLGTVSEAGQESFPSLGDALERGRPALIRARPLIKDLGRLGREAAPATKSLDELTASLQQTQGIERINDFLYYLALNTNGFDSIGHYLRAGLVTNTCSSYFTEPAGGCNANFYDPFTGPASASLGARNAQFDERNASGGNVPAQGTLLEGLLGGEADPSQTRQRNEGIARLRQRVERGQSPALEGGEPVLDYLLGGEG